MSGTKAISEPALGRAKSESAYFRLRSKGWAAVTAARHLGLTHAAYVELEAAWHSPSRGIRGQDAPNNKDPEYVAAVWAADPKGFLGSWSFDRGGAGFKVGPVVVPGPAYTRSAL